MSRFVDECRREWHRLGVPDAVANEMAADLTADLEEAEADGVSPEEVLGNGVFDPRSFAASWATARGVVRTERRVPQFAGRGRRAVVAVVAAVSFLAALLGVVAIIGRRSAAVAVAVVHHAVTWPFPRGLGPPAIRIGPGPVGRLLVVHQQAFVAFGLVLLVIGLAGFAVTLWLWKPWSTRRRRNGVDENVGMPSFL